MITMQNINSGTESWTGRGHQENDIYNKQYVRRLEKKSSDRGYKLIESFSVPFSSALADIRSGAAKAPSALPFII